MAYYNLNKNNRKYVCFVCGEEYMIYDDLKKHILGSHEISKDYVLCPLKRCGCPVRCLRTHFKSNHPQEKLPNVEQYKALIWKDQKTKKKTITRKFKEGNFFSKKNNEVCHFRSGFEENFYKALEKMPSVLKYKPEPFKIEYFFEGFTHNYIPDILVEKINGKKELWEIKPKSQTKLPKNKAKWGAANEYCKKRNWDFIVYTEKGLKDLNREINRLL